MECERWHGMMIQGYGYSVWLIPPESVYTAINDVISSLRSRYSDPVVQYQAPSFEPHLTLLGRLLGPEMEIISKTQKFASRIRPFNISLDTLGDLDGDYFRCVFVRAKKTEELMSANSIAGQIFDRGSDPKYMPHMSLIYGCFLPEVRKRIIATANQLDPRIASYFYRVDRLSLFLTDGTVNKWRKVKDFLLNPG